MNNQWHDELPIYKQLVIKLKQAILAGTFAEETALPSVRVVSAELNINHITVSKAYHELVDEGLIEKKRGLGMFIMKGAVSQLLEAERMLFIEHELPKLINKMEALKIPVDDVIAMIKQSNKGNTYE